MNDLKLFASEEFIPHGHSYFWKPGILWTHALSDGLIGISCFAIVLYLIFIVRKRLHAKYRWILLLFGIFMYSCAATHLMNIVTIWQPLYHLEGIIKAITAISSVGVVLAFVKIMPKVLTIPMVEESLKVNQESTEQKQQFQEKEKSLLPYQKELKESEECYHVLREIFDGIFIHIDNQIVYANPAATTWLGVKSPEQLAGINIMDFVHPQVAKEVSEDIRKASQGEKIPLIERKFIRMNGEEIEGEVIHVPFTFQEKAAVQTIARDITYRKQREKLLTENESKFRGLFESYMIGTLFWEIDGKVNDANDAFLEMIGYTREDMLTGNINWRQLTPEEFHVRDQQAYNEIIHTGVHQPYEKEYIHKDGSRVPILIGGAFMKGSTNKGVSYLFDITERKKQETILRESEARFRHLYELDMLGIIFSDLSSHIVDANDAFLRMTGYSREELINGQLDWKNLTPPEYEAADLEARKAIGTTGSAPPYEKEYVCKDGSRISIFIGAALLKDTNQVVAYVLDITELKKQEKLTRESEARFKRLFESNLIGIKFSTADGKATEANDAFLNLIGYTREDLKNEQINWKQLTPPEYTLLDGKATQILEENHEVLPYEKEYIRKDGSRVAVIIGLSRVEGDRNNIVSFMLDISEQKKQEKVLKENEAKFRGIFESGMMGIVFIDFDGNLLESNHAFLKILGYDSSDQLPAIKWKNMSLPEFKDVDAKAWSDLMTIGVMPPYEKELPCKDGNRVPVLISASKIAGYTNRAVAFILDMTQQDKVHKELNQRASELQRLNAELQENQEILRLSEARFKHMFMSDLIGIIFWDKQGNFLEVNNLFLQTIGYSREDWLNGKLNWIKLTPPEYAALDQDKLAEMDQKGAFTSYEKEYIRKDGSRVPILLGGTKLQGFSDRGVSYILDITNLKKIQRELEERARELALSNEELEQFAYIASHDLQEPIRTMAGFANLLEKKYKNRLDQDANEFIEFIVDAAERMKKLISNLLEYSRINSKAAPYESVDFNTLVNRIMIQWQTRIQPAKVEFICEPLPVLTVNEGQISQVFQHLIGNAVKFRDAKPLIIRISATEQATHWLFSVSDTGIGIDMAYTTRIFQVFQRLHSRDQYEGTGIGLSVCKKIVEKYRGEIWVDSILGEGSTFFFTLRK